MNYKDVIIPEKIDSYKEQHRIFYQALNSMIFDISFINACVDLQDDKLANDWITIKFLHRNVFENLVSKVYRCFYDNSGRNSININHYKNNVIGRFLKENYRNIIREQVKKLPFESADFIKRKNKLGKNILNIRHDYIAHRLLTASDDSEVNLNEITVLVEYGCQLFQALSFEPRDFYTMIEGDGYDFSKELNYTYKLTRNFIKTSYLSSKYITHIDCQFEENCSKSVQKRLKAIIRDLNSYR